MPRISLSSFKRQSGLRTLFDSSNHKTIRGFFPFDGSEGQLIDTDGALRPTYPPTQFASITEVDGNPVILHNSSTFSSDLESTAIGLFLTAGGYLYHLHEDGTYSRVGYPGLDLPQFTHNTSAGLTSVLHRGEFFLHVNKRNASSERLYYPYFNGTSGVWEWRQTTGSTILLGTNALYSFRDMVVILPIDGFSSNSSGSFIQVQKMKADKSVVPGFQLAGPQMVRHVSSINTDYVVIFTDTKTKPLGTNYDLHPNDGLLCYLWNGEDTTWTRLMKLPYRGVIGTARKGSEMWAFTYDDKNVYALFWDGNSFNEKARTAFTFNKTETAEIGYTDGVFVFMFMKQMAEIRWNIDTGECAEVMNLGLTSGINAGFMSPDALYTFLAAAPDAGIVGQTGRIIRVNSDEPIPSNGTVTATPFFTSDTHYYESNILVPPKREDMRMSRVKLNHLIVQGEKLDTLGSDTIIMKIYGRDETDDAYSEIYSMTISGTAVNTVPTKKNCLSSVIGKEVTSFYVTITYTRASATSIWSGEIKQVLVDFDITNVTM